MALPNNADRVVVRGFWWDETTQAGVGGTITFDPVPLTGTSTPNVRDATSYGHIKTRQRIARPDATTGYYAAMLLSSNDPDLDAYGGRRVTFSGETPFIIEVPYNAPTVTVDAPLAAALPELHVGDNVKAVWLVDAALVTTPPPTPLTSYLSSEQTLGAIADGVEAHDGSNEAHPDLRAAIQNATIADATTSTKGKAKLLGGTADNPTVPYSAVTGAPTSLPPSGGAGGVLSGTFPNPGFANDMATQAELDAVAASIPEAARDALGAALVAGSNVTITPNDAADTITISVTVPSSYSDEQAQDAFAALIAAGTHSGISFAYNDAGNALSATVTAQTWSQITGKPTFAAVATSGSYTDLTNQPTIPSTTGLVAKDTIAVNVKDHGVVGNGTTNDTTALQALVDSTSTAGGGTLHFPAGTYRVGGLVLKSGVVLSSGRGVNGVVYSSVSQVKLQAIGTPTWMIDTPPGQQYACGIDGIDLLGDQSATVGGGGIRFQNVDYALVRNSHVHGFKNQGVLQLAGQAAQIDTVLISGCLLDTTRSTDAGALEVRGDDAMIRATEAGCSQSARTSSSLHNCGVLVTGGNPFLSEVVGEFADAGVRVASWTPRLAAVRGDRNFGPGVHFTSASYGGAVAASTSHHNSQHGDGAYPGWLVESKSTAFAGCSAPVDPGDANRHSYGFQDDTTWTGTDRNTYAACTATRYSVALFSDSGKLAPSSGDVAASITVASGRNQFGPRFAFFGDSVTNYNETYGYYAAWLSNGKIEPTVIASNPGHSSTQLAAEISQVTTSTESPNVCVVCAGTNDAGGNATLATFSGNIQTIVAALRAAGIVPVLTTVPPRSARASLVATYNAWLTRWANLQGIPLVDFFSLVADPTTGEWLSAYSAGDGIHPNADGNRLFGQAVADVLAPQIATDPQLVVPFSGAPNLLPNSQFLSGTSTPSGGYFGNFSGTGYTPSLLTDTAGFKWQRVTVSGASASTVGLQYQVDAGAGTFAVGDRVRFSARLRLPADVGPGNVGEGISLKLVAYTTGYASSPGGVDLTAAPLSWGALTRHAEGILSREWVIPSTTALLLLQGQVGPAAGTYDFAQPTLLNLTKLGVA